MGTSDYFTFVRLPSYIKAAHGLLTDTEEREIERVLCADPAAGDTVANAGGVAISAAEKKEMRQLTSLLEQER
jgi:glutamate dehydrogenase/leucine dehydrogenase